MPLELLTKHVTKNYNNDILCLFSFINNIWHNILGQFPIQYYILIAEKNNKNNYQFQELGFM
jgi:hypothetical protein